MKRLIYAVVALSALGLGAANIAQAGDNDEQSGQTVQSPSDQGAQSGTVKQSDEDKDKSDTKSDDGK